MAFLVNRRILNTFVAYTIPILFISASSCKKYLDEKPDQKLAIPTTIEDLQALLDQSSYTNEKSPSWGEASADDYYILQTDYDALPTVLQKAYTWEDFPNKEYPNDWGYIYDVIYYANVALEGIDKITPPPNRQMEWNNVKGSALFIRSLSFHRAVLQFSKAYDASTSDQDLGIVLRQGTDFNQKSQRSSVEQTYDKIIADLKSAAPLLPDLSHPMRPSRAAAFGLLARVYLSMRNYDSCYKYSNLSLSIKDYLMDYNIDADPGSFLFPFQRFNREVTYSSIINIMLYGSVAVTTARIDTTLYSSYNDNDLRKTAFFVDATAFGLPPGHFFQGTYNGTFSEYFVGLATDEILLMRAESNARLNNKDAAINDLNTLMVKRWNNNGTWVPFAANSSDEALSLILKERRKELIFRGLRWMDIKRLNKEGANIDLKRVINNQTYLLAPNEARYALLLPVDIIDLTGMPQNPR